MAKIPVSKTNKKVPIQLSIKSIHLLENKIDLPAEYDYSNRDAYNFKIEVDIKTIAETSIIQIIIAYEFMYNEYIILSLKSSTEFKIINYKDAVTDGKVTSSNFVDYLIETSIAHLRGMQAYLTKDTPIANFLTPFGANKKLIK